MMSDKIKSLAQCGECTKLIRSTSGRPNIKCSRCLNIFHPICVNITDVKGIDESNWVCPLCRCKEPKRDNSNTPVRSVPATATSGDNSGYVPRSDAIGKPATIASPVVVPTSPDSDNIDILIAEIKLMRGDIGEIKSQMTSLSDLVKHCVSRIDEHENKLSDFDRRVRKLEEREGELLMSRNKISELRQELDSRAQASLRNEVEISGINEQAEENQMHLLQVISHKIGAKLDCNLDLDFVTRVGPRGRRTADRDDADGEAATRPPRPLVVRFLRRHTCEAFLVAGKSRRNLSCADIGVAGTPRTIYINERLTQGNRVLFRSARRYAKTADYKFCWVKGGSIYVRKREGNPAIPIKNMDDLERQFGPPPI